MNSAGNGTCVVRLGRQHARRGEGCRQLNVRYGSLADIGEAVQGCPLLPPEADILIVGIDVCFVP